VVYNRTFETIPLLMVAVIWYLVITSVLYFGQSFVERYYARGATRIMKRSFLASLRVRQKEAGYSAGFDRGQGA